MKDFQEIAEKVLSGELKGTFILRNGELYDSSNLRRNTDKRKSYYYPYMLYIGNCTWQCYTTNGKISILEKCKYDIIDFIPDIDKIEIDPELYSYNEKDIQFIEHFIKGHHMKENELTIEIPNNKIVDWDESKKQNKIVLKDKQLTYEDVCKKLFSNGGYFINVAGGICHTPNLKGIEYQFNNALSRHQLECILAKNKLANVAKYLNDGWKPDFSDDLRVFVIYNYMNNILIDNENSLYAKGIGHIIFKSQELAAQAIEILGEETIKLALEPLGV